MPRSLLAVGLAAVLTVAAAEVRCAHGMQSITRVYLLLVLVLRARVFAAAGRRVGPLPLAVCLCVRHRRTLDPCLGVFACVSAREGRCDCADAGHL